MQRVIAASLFGIFMILAAGELNTLLTQWVESTSQESVIEMQLAVIAELESALDAQQSAIESQQILIDTLKGDLAQCDKDPIPVYEGVIVDKHAT